MHNTISRELIPLEALSESLSDAPRAILGACHRVAGSLERRRPGRARVTIPEAKRLDDAQECALAMEHLHY